MNGIKEDIKSIGVLDNGSPSFQEALWSLSKRLKLLQVIMGKCYKNILASRHCLGFWSIVYCMLDLLSSNDVALLVYGLIVILLHCFNSNIAKSTLWKRKRNYYHTWKQLSWAKCSNKSCWSSHSMWWEGHTHIYSAFSLRGSSHWKPCST